MKNRKIEKLKKKIDHSKSPNFESPNIPTVPIWQSANLEVIFQLATLPIWQSRNLAIWQSGNAENLRKSARLGGARSRLDRGQILQVNTQRAAFGQIYPHPQLLHRPASKIFRNGRRRSRQRRRNFRKFAENLQSCRGSFAAGWRPYFASKYATGSSRRDLPATPAFAPPRVENFSKRSATKSPASPKFSKICRKLAILPGLALVWIEAKFCK